MRIESQPQDHPSATAAETATLLVSFELSQSKWVLKMQQPNSSKLPRFTVPARDTAGMLSLLTTQRAQVERRVGQAGRIVSIYEAGLDGFWLHAGWRRRRSRATRWTRPRSWGHSASGGRKRIVSTG